MKTYILVFSMCLFGAINISSQTPNISWSKYFKKDSLHNDKTGDQNDIRSHYVVETSDKGFAITGHCCCAHCNGDLFIMKTDTNGAILWSQRYDDNNRDEVGNCIQQTADGGYIVAGGSQGNYDCHMLLVRTDLTGNELWRKTVGISGDFYYSGTAYSVRETVDSGFIIVGYTYPSDGSSDVYLLRLSSNGDSIWAKTIGGPENEWGHCVQQTRDNGFIICGVAHSSGATEEKIYLIRTGPSGDTLWTRTFGKPNMYSGGYYIEETADDGYVITGYTNDYQDMYLVRTDMNGNLLWSRTIGENDDSTEWGRVVKETADNGFLIGGLIGINRPSAYLVRTDSLGNVVWTKTCDNTHRSLVMGMDLTSDGGIAITTRVHEGATAESGFELIKLK